MKKKLKITLGCLIILAVVYGGLATTAHYSSWKEALCGLLFVFVASAVVFGLIALLAWCFSD